MFRSRAFTARFFTARFFGGALVTTTRVSSGGGVGSSYRRPAIRKLVDLDEDLLLLI